MNAAGQKAASTLGGSGAMTQAYGAIATAPGVNIPSNQQGWYQSVYIRGGDVDQVAYEFDGMQMTRQSDLAPIGTLTSLGNQEVQVYTGGTPATSNSSGLAGYINQVIKTGTFPGYASADFGIGGPAFYHQATLEVGGATPDRLFSYYVGLSGTNQTYRFGDQYGGVSDPLYFYPLNVPSNNNVYNILDGSAAKQPNYGFLYSPGYAYAQGTNFDRENVVNLHIGIPHRNSSLRDDVQLLYVTGGIADQFLSSASDVWYTPYAGKKTGIGYPMPYLDSLYYGGPLMQTPRAQDLIIGFFPSSPSGRAPGSPVDPSDRDGNWNGYSIEKLQYQKNLDPHSYLRGLVWGAYSNWFINGPQSAQLVFGSDPADYEVLEHGFGGTLIYANQLSSQNLLTAEASYMTQRLQTYNAAFSSTDPSTTSLAPTGLGTILSSYGTPNGKCYNYVTGQPWSCFDAGSQGRLSHLVRLLSGRGKVRLQPDARHRAEELAGGAGRRALDDDRERAERAGRRRDAAFRFGRSHRSLSAQRPAPASTMPSANAARLFCRIRLIASLVRLASPIVPTMAARAENVQHRVDGSMASASPATSAVRSVANLGAGAGDRRFDEGKPALAARAASRSIPSGAQVVVQTRWAGRRSSRARRAGFDLAPS